MRAPGRPTNPAARRVRRRRGAAQRSVILAIAPEQGLELAKSHSLCDGDEHRFPFPLLADPGMEIFRRYGAYDDFELMPLHGTCLISPDGKVIWQDIGADAFMEAEFHLEEAKRQLGRRAG